MRVLKDFLNNDELKVLQTIADERSGWTPGRQGTGYEVLYMKNAEPSQFLRPGGVLHRIRELMLPISDDFWDFYLIRYQTGSYIPLHKDEAPLFGKRHQRLNALIRRPEKGGELFISNSLIELNIGDAVLFFPDEEEHEVTKVLGERLLLSAGLWADK